MISFALLNTLACFFFCFFFFSTRGDHFSKIVMGVLHDGDLRDGDIGGDGDRRMNDADRADGDR